MKSSSFITASALVVSAGLAQGQGTESVHSKLNPGGAPSCTEAARDTVTRVGTVYEYPSKETLIKYVKQNPQARILKEVAEATVGTGCDWRKDIKSGAFSEIPNNAVYAFAAAVHTKAPSEVIKKFLGMK